MSDTTTTTGPRTEVRTMNKGTAREFARIYLFCPDGHEVVSAGRDGSACGRRLAAGDYSGESCGHGSCTWDGGPRKRQSDTTGNTCPLCPRMVSDADHAVLDTAWREAFAALRAAGLEADSDDPIAARYRAASDAVNHANRSRDFHIFARHG